MMAAPKGVGVWVLLSLDREVGERGKSGIECFKLFNYWCGVAILRVRDDLLH